MLYPTKPSSKSITKECTKFNIGPYFSPIFVVEWVKCGVMMRPSKCVKQAGTGWVQRGLKEAWRRIAGMGGWQRREREREGKV